MRISDWSSDVCSSDLASGANGGTTSSNTGYLRPDNFYVAGEADKMVQGLRSAFENIIEETVGSSGSFAANTTKLETGAMTYQARLYSGSWRGDLLAYQVDVDSKRSEEQKTELQSLMSSSSAVFCLKKKK